jgi:hypothetical protein
MLLFTITKLDVTIFEAVIVFTLRLHVRIFDELKLEVDIFDVVIVVVLAFPITSSSDDGVVVPIPT